MGEPGEVKILTDLIKMLSVKQDEHNTKLERLLGKLEQKEKACSDHAQNFKDLKEHVIVLTKQFNAEIGDIVDDTNKRFIEQGKRIGSVETEWASFKAAEAEALRQQDKVSKMFTTWHEWAMLAATVGSLWWTATHMGG